MKKVFALAVVLGLAACAPKEPAAPAVDSTAAAAPAPAPATTDSTAPAADTTKKDSAAVAAPAQH